MRRYKFQTIDAWLLHQLRLLNQEWDNWHLWDGEEGSGKSTGARKVAGRLDYLMRNHATALIQLMPKGPWLPLRDHWKPNFPIPRPFTLAPGATYNQPGDSIRWGQDGLLDFLSILEACGVAVGDEIEGSRRLAMHSERLELLDHVKESRFFRHNVFCLFNQFTDFETAMTNRRFRWWEHTPRRGWLVVRERISKTTFDRTGKVLVDTKWPIVGEFPMTAENDPLKPVYMEKKETRGRDRRARRNDDGPSEPAKVQTLSPGLLDAILAEVKK